MMPAPSTYRRRRQHHTICCESQPRSTHPAPKEHGLGWRLYANPPCTCRISLGLSTLVQFVGDVGALDGAKSMTVSPMASRGIEPSAGAPGIRRPKHSKSPLGGRAKRLFDLCFAALCLISIAPLLIMVAIAVRLSSPGPVFFGHARIGFDGNTFRCLKFRTMVTNGEVVLQAHFADHPEAEAEWQETRKLQHDPRVTRLGHVLRKSSVDELPQLINVLLGQMSLIGPRPVVEDELDRYGDEATAYLATRPGITGLWQTSGRSDTSYEQRVALDKRYVAEWSFWLDLRILLKTIPVVLGSKGAV